MTYSQILHRLTGRCTLNAAEAEPIAAYERDRPFSLFGELRTTLYLGVTLLSTGLGILIYQNLDTIGHQTIVALIALLMVGCFGYAWKHRQPYAHRLVPNDTLFDFILLLGCLLFLTLEGYLQFAYQAFGTRYGLATLLPAALFLPLAYRFDHRGVLAMGLTALASWVGLTIAPLDLLTSDQFRQMPLIDVAIGFGVVVMGAALSLENRGIKPHFTTTYLTLAGNLSLAAALVGWFGDRVPVLYLVILTGLCAGFGWYARRNQSFFFLLLALVYGYIGLTYLFFRLLPDELLGIVGLYYFLFSCGGIVWLLFRYKQVLGLKK
jgi:hypothetical protein